MAIKLIYKDLPLGSEEDAAITTGNYESFSKPNLLPYGVSSGAVATLERNSWGLSPDIKARGNQPFAFWSNYKSDKNGIFATPPTITIEFSEQYTATGLSFRFAPGVNEYCNKVNVEWWQNGAIKARGDFFPSSAVYTLENTVEAFDKIVVKLLSTNLPERRAKLEALITGVVREIDGKELISSQYINEIDLISDTVPINVLDAEFHSLSNADLVFQKKQPVEAYDKESLIGVYYIDAGERTGENNYTFSCQDAIGVLDKDTYSGGLWFEEVLAEDILNDIIAGAFEIELEEALKGRKIKGHIPRCTKREAIQQIAFALGAVVDTSGTKKIKMFLAPSGEGAEIPATETYIGGKVTTADTVTEVVVYGYEILDEEPPNFETPWESSIEVDGESYYMRIQPATATNPNISAGTLTNKIEYKDCYLIGLTDAQSRADAILAYYMRRNTYNASHIVNGQKPSDRARISLPWGNAQSGNILKMQVVTSGITVSNTDFLLD